MPKFIVKSGEEVGRDIPMTGKRLVFGRSDECDVILADANVSRVHAHAIDLDGLIALVDLNSSNGTFVNELPISRVFLMDGDEVRLGESVFVYSTSESVGRDVAGATNASSFRLQPPGSKPGSEPKVAGEIERTLMFEPIPEAQQVEALKDTYLKLKSIYRVFIEVAQASSLSEMFEAVGRALTVSGGAERAVFLLASDKEADGWQRFHTESSANLDERLVGGPVSDAVVRRAAEEQKMVQAKAAADGTADFAGAEANATAVPLFRGGKLFAILYADNPSSTAALTKDNADFIHNLGMQLSLRLRQAEQVQQLQKENVQLRQQVESEFAVIVRNEKMRTVMALTERVAESDSSVLIHGESGTGKELIARSIHRFSPRSSKPLVAVNCAALPETLLESELFGHEKGSFTGALEKRVGKFELADGGTLFLDEIGDISAAAQAKLLRALQEGEIQRVGGNRTVKVDVRLIAATNKNLAEEVKRGNFRQDLFFRIKVIDIEVPPLRDRRDDIPALAEYFLKVLKQKLPTKVRAYSPEAMEILQRHSFPGNVRELRNIVERALVFATGETVLPEHLPVEVFDAEEPLPQGGASHALQSLSADGSPLSLADMEKRHIRFVLDHAKGNKLRAAQLLGISRTTLYEKLKTYEVGD